MVISAIIGLLIPEATKLVGSWLQEKKDAAEHQRKIDLLKLAHDQEVDMKDIESFTKAQMELSGGMTVPTGATVWQQWLCLGVNASIHAVRPVLTGLALAILFYILYSTTGSKRDMLLDEVVITCVAIMRYWFGYRESLRGGGKK